MARIVDTNTSPPTILDSVDVLDFLDPQYVQTDGKKRWHSLLKSEIPGKLKAGYLLNPDLSAVRNVDGTAKLPARYWKADTKTNALVSMDATEKADVDLRLNPPDPERDAVSAILDKADTDITAAEVKRVLLRVARKLKAQGAL